uniref:Uncharacterized protein n=1 Tax=Avena sativa TaxID=4498 RepID=A0ACD5T7W9_AVESA
MTRCSPARPPVSISWRSCRFESRRHAKSSATTTAADLATRDPRHSFLSSVALYREASSDRSMAGLQRSSGTFRRSGSSGMVWDDDRHLSGEIARPSPAGRRGDEDRHLSLSGEIVRPSPAGRHGAGGDEGPPARVQRSRSHGHGGYRASAGRVSPALDPPSPRVAVCGLCAFFRGKTGKPKPKIVPRAAANHPPRARRASG